MIRRPPRSTLFPLHDALPISYSLWRRRLNRGHRVATPFGPRRSEEHTSELQSQSNLVCRLLLEKKKSTHASYSSVAQCSSRPHTTSCPTPTTSHLSIPIQLPY